MAKEIIPYKLIVELNEDNTCKNAVFQYRIKENGVMQNRFLTMTVNPGITINNLNSVLAEAKMHVEQGEGI